MSGSPFSGDDAQRRRGWSALAARPRRQQVLAMQQAIEQVLRNEPATGDRAEIERAEVEERKRGKAAQAQARRDHQQKFREYEQAVRVAEELAEVECEDRLNQASRRYDEELVTTRQVAQRLWQEMPAEAKVAIFEADDSWLPAWVRERPLLGGVKEE